MHVNQVSLICLSIIAAIHFRLSPAQDDKNNAEVIQVEATVIDSVCPYGRDRYGKCMPRYCRYGRDRRGKCYRHCPYGRGKCRQFIEGIEYYEAGDSLIAAASDDQEDGVQASEGQDVFAAASAEGAEDTDSCPYGIDSWGRCRPRCPYGYGRSGRCRRHCPYGRDWSGRCRHFDHCSRGRDEYGCCRDDGRLCGSRTRRDDGKDSWSE